jgi:hypothetical protein
LGKQRPPLVLRPYEVGLRRSLQIARYNALNETLLIARFQAQARWRAVRRANRHRLVQIANNKSAEYVARRGAPDPECEEGRPARGYRKGQQSWIRLGQAKAANGDRATSGYLQPTVHRQSRQWRMRRRKPPKRQHGPYPLRRPRAHGGQPRCRHTAITCRARCSGRWSG